ncbi:glycosyl transferase family 4 [Candidatus Pacearchaeota archaeon]|nr:glycosyl transferase family 4 [Candidatus Pacearchaeota archaeon]
MDYINFIFIGISFIITLYTLPIWMRKAKQIGLIWDDMNKQGKQKIPGSGGIAVLVGFIGGVLTFIAYHTFITKSNVHTVEVFALLVSCIIMGGIGLIDDLLGWQRGGLSIRSRLLLALGAALPLMAINAGKSIISVPFIGTLDAGIMYPLFLIPLAFVGAGTTFNFLAGFNGLEAGQGVLLIGAVSVVAYLTGSSWLAIIGLCMVASLLVFLYYNRFPAKVFPGDVLTYPVGGLIAGMCILGNFEKIALLFFIPIILEVILKSRGSFKKSSFGLPQKDGSLKQRYDKIYGLTHLGITFLQKMGLQATEQRVTLLIWAFQLLIIIETFIYLRGAL